jgi:hypothetical protein
MSNKFSTEVLTSILLKGSSDEEQLASLPSAKHLLDMALYPAVHNVSDDIFTCKAETTLELKVDGKVIDTCTSNKPLSAGRLPDIHLADYTLDLSSQMHERGKGTVRDMIVANPQTSYKNHLVTLRLVVIVSDC